MGRGRGECKAGVFFFFEDHPVVEFAAKAGVYSRVPSSLFVAAGGRYHPAGAPRPDAVVKAIKFHRGGYGTFTEQFGHKSALLSTAVLELPAVQFLCHFPCWSIVFNNSQYGAELRVRAQSIHLLFGGYIPEFFKALLDLLNIIQGQIAKHEVLVGQRVF